MITISYVTIQYFILHEKSGDENEIFKEAIDEMKNHYPSLENVTIITLFFGLASGLMDGGGQQHDRRMPRAMQPLVTKFKTKPKLCEFGYFY